MFRGFVAAVKTIEYVNCFR